MERRGDRPLCPLKVEAGCLKGCGLGTEWSVPSALHFFGVVLGLVGKWKKGARRSILLVSGGVSIFLLFLAVLVGLGGSFGQVVFADVGFQLVF